MNENPITPVPRDIAVITTEINLIVERTYANVSATLLEGAIEVGRRLCEAKEALPHGEWGKWLAESVRFSQSTAQNFMRVFKECGSPESPSYTLFSKSQTFGNLPYTKVLQLFGLPAEEREDFIAENDVVEMSSRELAQAIKERDEAREEAKRAREDAEAGQAAIREKKTLQGAFERAREHVEEANARAAAAEQAAAEAKEAAKKKNDRVISAAVKKALAEQQETLEKTQAELKAAQEVLEAAKKREEDLLSKAAAERQESEEKLIADAACAQEEAQKRIAELEAKLQRAMDPSVQKFTIYFEDFSNGYIDLKKVLSQIEDEETGIKFCRAIKMQLQAFLSDWEDVEV